MEINMNDFIAKDLGSIGIAGDVEEGSSIYMLVRNKSGTTTADEVEAYMKDRFYRDPRGPGQSFCHSFSVFENKYTDAKIGVAHIQYDV